MGKIMYLLWVRSSAKNFIFFISFSLHQLPQRSLVISSLTDSIYLFTELIFTEYLIHGQELLEAEWDEALKALNNGMNRDVIYRD